MRQARKLYNPIETLKEAQRQFREIFNITVIPKPVYEKEKSIINSLKEKIIKPSNNGERYESLKQLMDYTVSVPRWYVKTIEYFCEDIYIVSNVYDHNKGFLSEENINPIID